MKLKRYEDSLREIQEVLHRMDVGNVKAFYIKAQVLELMGRYDEANEVIDKYFELYAQKVDPQKQQNEKLFT